MTRDFACNLTIGCVHARLLYDLRESPNKLERLDAKTCVEKYSVDFLSQRRNLLLITNSTTAKSHNGLLTFMNGSVFGMFDSESWETSLSNGNGDWQPTSWWCNGKGEVCGPNDYSISPRNNFPGRYLDSCSVSDATSHLDQLQFIAEMTSWASEEFSTYASSETWLIDHCFSQVVPEECELGFSVYIMIIVIFCNLVKLFSMLFSLLVLTDRPIVVVGDAISSYLSHPDESTEGKCLMDAHIEASRTTASGYIWKFQRHFWFSAATSSSITRLFFL